MFFVLRLIVDCKLFISQNEFFTGVITMKSLQHYIDQMNQSLHALIEVATQLRDMSLQVIAEEDLARLQKKQEELLMQLEKIDGHLQKDYKYQLDGAIQEHFHEQLQIFQQLNQEFVQNLSTSHGVIQFELHRFAEEKDFPNLSRLNKILSSPDSAKAIESEENEES